MKETLKNGFGLNRLQENGGQSGETQVAEKKKKKTTTKKSKKVKQAESLRLVS